MAKSDPHAVKSRTLALTEVSVASASYWTIELRQLRELVAACEGLDGKSMVTGVAGDDAERRDESYITGLNVRGETA